MTGQLNPRPTPVTKRHTIHRLTPLIVLFLLISCASSPDIKRATATATKPTPHPKVEEQFPEEVNSEHAHVIKDGLGVYLLKLEAKTNLNVSNGALHVGVFLGDSTLTRRHPDLMNHAAPIMFECGEYGTKTSPTHTFKPQRWTASASVRCMYNSDRIDVYVTIRPSEETYDMAKRRSFAEAVVASPPDTAAPVTVRYVFLDDHRSHIVWEKTQTYGVHEVVLRVDDMPVKRKVPLTPKERADQTLASDMTIKYTHAPPHNVLDVHADP